MKVTSVGSDKAFRPIEITITMETEGEMEAMHNIFNCSEILMAAGIEGEAIREAIEAQSPVGSSIRTLNTRGWKSFYTSLKNSYNEISED